MLEQALLFISSPNIQNTFSKIVFPKNINFTSLIYSSSESSESSEELSKSSVICLNYFFSQCNYTLLKRLLDNSFRFF